MCWKNSLPRRDLLAVAATAFTTQLFTGNMKGANDRVSVAFIGLGAMGSGNLGYALTQWLRLEGFYAGSHQTIDRPGGLVDRNRIGFQLITSSPLRVR